MTSGPRRTARPTLRRSTAALLMAVAALVSGCDRGNHPEQLDKKAPLFALNDGQRTVNLGQLRGQVVVLNFWATWCAPCIEELPSLEALQQALPQVKVVAVAFDEDATTYHNYLSRHPVPLFTVLDANQSANALYGTFRPPETYVIDKEGVIRRKFIGAQDWTSPEIVSALRKLAS